MEKARERNARFLGEILPVLIDNKDPRGDGYWGRYSGQAPDVDGQVYVRGGKLIPGYFAPVRITETDEENLMGYVNADIQIATA